MTESWRCPLSGEAGPPLALALLNQRHPEVPPLLLSPTAVQAALDAGLAEVATALARRRLDPSG